MTDASTSVLISVWNGADTLSRALASIAAQTARPLEVIVVNDGSTDGTGSILAAWCRQHPRLNGRIIEHATRRGLTASLNEALRAARGRYIARLDADDWWTPDKLAKQLHFLNQHPDVGVLGSDYINVRGADRTRIYLPASDAAIRRAIWYRNPFGHSAAVVRRALMIACGGYDESYTVSQDYDLWFRLLPLTHLANRSEPLCYRTVAPEGKPRGQERAQIRATLRLLRRHLLERRPGLRAYLGLIPPLLLWISPRWTRTWLSTWRWGTLAALTIGIFLALQTAASDYGTTINDLPYVALLRPTPSVVAAGAQALHRSALLDPGAPPLPDEAAGLRFKLYSVNADEMVSLMALARLNPAAGAFDPHLYQYGGGFLYPLAAWYGAAVGVGLIPQPTLERLLDSPALVDWLYVNGRRFVLLTVALSAWFLYLAGRQVAPPAAAALGVIVYLASPATIAYSIQLKPHWYALAPATLAVLLYLRGWRRKHFGRSAPYLIGGALGLAAGSAVSLAPFGLFLLAALAVAGQHRYVKPIALIIVALSAAVTFLLTNPYVLLNRQAWLLESHSHAAWFSPALSWPVLAAFIKNSYLPAFGVAGAAALVLSLYHLVTAPRRVSGLIGAGILGAIIFAASITALTAGAHTNARFIPYLLPVAALYVARTLPRRFLVLATIASVLVGAPTALAHFDENHPRFGTRLAAATWIHEHVPAGATVCARLVPYDTAPFDWQRYRPAADGCAYRVIVQRQPANPRPGAGTRVAYFAPRWLPAWWPPVHEHVNPVIEIYAEPPV